MNVKQASIAGRSERQTSAIGLVYIDLAQPRYELYRRAGESQ